MSSIGAGFGWKASSSWLGRTLIGLALGVGLFVAGPAQARRSHSRARLTRPSVTHHRSDRPVAPVSKPPKKSN